MKVKYPLKTKIQFHAQSKEWLAEIQYAPKYGTNQEKYSMINNCSTTWYCQTKEEAIEKAKSWISEKKHIKARKDWRSNEKYCITQNAIKKAKKFGKALSQLNS